jgi:hypothetical protein
MDPGYHGLVASAVEIHSNLANHSNVACDISSIIPYGVIVEASFTLPQDAIGCRQSKNTGETVCRNVVVREFPSANNRMLAIDDPAVNMTITDNDFEMQR